MRWTLAVFAGFLVSAAVARAADAPPKKRVIRGAPIYVLDRDGDGNIVAATTVPPNARAPAPAPVDAPRFRELSLPWMIGIFALLLGAKKFFTNTNRAELTLPEEPDEYEPGQTASATLTSAKQPTELKARLELYREDDDKPVRSLPASAGAPFEAEGGWRCPVAAPLPADAGFDFAGGWVLIVEGRAGGWSLYETVNVPVKGFETTSLRVLGGPFAPGGTVRAEFFSKSKPRTADAVLEYYSATDEEPSRSVPAALSAPQADPRGWRSEVEAVVPADSPAPAKDAGWILTVAAAIDGVDEVEEATVNTRA
jgi:hypothetical protein